MVSLRNKRVMGGNSSSSSSTDLNSSNSRATRSHSKQPKVSAETTAGAVDTTTDADEELFTEAEVAAISSKSPPDPVSTTSAKAAKGPREKLRARKSLSAPISKATKPKKVVPPPKRRPVQKKNEEGPEAKQQEHTSSKRKGTTTSQKTLIISAAAPDVLVIEDKFQPSNDPKNKKDAERIAQKRKELGCLATVMDTLKARRRSVYAAIGRNVYFAGTYKKFMDGFTKIQLTTLQKMEGKDRVVLPREASAGVKGGAAKGGKVGKCDFCSDTCDEFGCIDDCSCFIEQKRCYHEGNDDYVCGFCYVCDAMPDRHPRFGTHVAIETFLEQSPGEHHGLQASEEIPKNAIIGEYTGSVYQKGFDYFLKLHGCDGYIMDLCNGYVVDGYYGNQLRFVNASCVPNAEFEVWRFQGFNRIFLRATAHIAVDQHIYATYNWSAGGEDHED